MKGKSDCPDCHGTGKIIKGYLGGSRMRQCVRGRDNNKKWREKHPNNPFSTGKKSRRRDS